MFKKVNSTYLTGCLAEHPTAIAQNHELHGTALQQSSKAMNSKRKRLKHIVKCKLHEL